MEHCANKHNISEKGFIENCVSGVEKQALYNNLSSTLVKNNNCSVEEINSKVDTIIFDCLKDPQCASSTAENSLKSDSKAESPVLGSKLYKRLEDFSQLNNHVLSPVLSKTKDNSKGKSNKYYTKTTQCTLSNNKESMYLKKNEYKNVHHNSFSKMVCSPILDSSKHTKEIFMRKLRKGSFKFNLKSKIYLQEFTPSPVLDASENGNSNCQNNHLFTTGKDNKKTELQIEEYLSETKNKPQNEIFINSTQLDEKINQIEMSHKLLTNNILNLNTHEEISQPLSQVLISSFFRARDINKTESELKQIETIISLAPEQINSYTNVEHSLENTLLQEKEVGENAERKKQRLSVLFNEDKPNESFYSVSDSSQIKRKLSKNKIESKSSECAHKITEIRTNSQSRQNDTENLETHCNEENLISKVLQSHQLQETASICNLRNDRSIPDATCDRANVSNVIPKGCLLDPMPLTLAVNNLPDSVYNHAKRVHSPISDSKSKFKKYKTEGHVSGVKNKGPMIGSVFQVPDDNICINTTNSDIDENMNCEPTFNSELDISKFPVVPFDLENKSPSGRLKNHLSDNKCDSIPLKKRLMIDDERLYPKVSFHSKIESNFSDQCKLTKNKFSENYSSNSMESFNSETISPVLTTNKAYKKSHFLPRSSKHTQNQFAVNNESMNAVSFSDYITSKRKVKKNLAPYFEEVEPIKSLMNKDCKNEIKVVIKDRESSEDALLSDVSQISGVEELQNLPSAESDKLQMVCKHQENRNFSKTILENNALRNDLMEPPVPLSSDKSILDSNCNKSGNIIKHKKQPYWKNQPLLFDDNEEIHIEDFDEESPSNTENVDITLDNSRTDMVKSNLGQNFEQNSSSSVIKKQAVSEMKQLLLNFEVDNQYKKICEYVPSQESNCEVEIQDFSQRTSERSPGFNIEYSTTPTAKSSEGTQDEVSDSNPPSFPPAIDVEANIGSVSLSPSAGVLDSACKNKRSKVKKGSAVERLQRLIRGQRAEVNMFHHEASALARAQTRACSLYVSSATQSCSLLVLSCKYADVHRMSSQDYGSEEEVVDPEVHVYVNPSYAKNVTAGCVVTVFPPWRSSWHESRGVVVMYCVTKLQLVPRDRSDAPGDMAGKSNRSDSPHTTLVEFSCQSQDDQCSCRSQLVEQLFTAPSHLLGSVESGGGATCGTISAVLAGGWFPQRVKLTLTVLHSFQARSRQNQVQSRLLCVDPSGNVCQLNLRSGEDLLKFGPSSEALYKTFIITKLTLCKRIFIDRCKGLRSFLTYLYTESVSQHVMYVATPSSDDWTAQLMDESADNQIFDLISRVTHCQRKLLTLPVNEESQGRARARVRVMAVRRDKLFVWDPRLDSYFKLSITPSAAIPSFPARTHLDLLYIWVNDGELTIDKFTEVSVVKDDSDSPSVPSLSVSSTEGELVLLDSIVTKVSSEAYLRWEGSCGHKVLRIQKTGMYFCVTCRQTSTSCTQKVVLEVSVVAEDVPCPVRVKVKSETAQVLLADANDQITSDKSYNVIGVIGSTLKCLAVVAQVLRNSFGDIIEFTLEEL